MIIPILATAIRALWLVIEYPYLRRYKVKPAKDWDRHSAKFWDVANAIEPVGLVLGFTNIGRIQTDGNFIAALGLAFLVAGIIIRWTAIYTLGKYLPARFLSKPSIGSSEPDCIDIFGIPRIPARCSLILD